MGADMMPPGPRNSRIDSRSGDQVDLETGENEVWIETRVR
jgi:hypothetical protein